MPSSPASAASAAQRPYARDGLLDLGRPERSRLAVVAVARERRRRHRDRARSRCEQLAPTVEQLHEEPGPVGLHRPRDATIRLDGAVEVARRSCVPSGDRPARSRPPPSRSGRPRPRPARTGRRRSRRSGGGRGRASSGARPRRCGTGSRPDRSSAAGTGDRASRVLDSRKLGEEEQGAPPRRILT